MALLQIISSFAYQWVESSWTVATIIVKAVLLLHFAKIISDKDISLKSFEQSLMKYSRLVVLLIVVLGFGMLVTGVEYTARFLLVSQLAALVYFGYLFWRF